MTLFIDEYPRYSTWANCMNDIIDVLSTAKRFDDVIQQLNDWAIWSGKHACFFYGKWYENACDLDYQRYIEERLASDIYETFARSIRTNPYCTYRIAPYSSPYPYTLNYAAIQAATDKSQ